MQCQATSNVLVQKTAMYLESDTGTQQTDKWIDREKDREGKHN